MIRFGLLKTSSFGKKNLGKLCLIFILVISMMLMSCDGGWWGDYTFNYTYEELSNDLISISIAYDDSPGGKIGEAVVYMETIYTIDSEEIDDIIKVLSDVEFQCYTNGIGTSSDAIKYIGYGIMLSYPDKKIVFKENDIFVLDKNNVVQGPLGEKFHRLYVPGQDERYQALLDKYLSDERVVKPSETAPSSDFAA